MKINKIFLLIILISKLNLYSEIYNKVYVLDKGCHGVYLQNDLKDKVILKDSNNFETNQFQLIEPNHATILERQKVQGWSLFGKGTSTIFFELKISNDIYKFEFTFKNLSISKQSEIYIINISELLINSIAKQRSKL